MVQNLVGMDAVGLLLCYRLAIVLIDVLSKDLIPKQEELNSFTYRRALSHGHDCLTQKIWLSYEAAGHASRKTDRQPDR